MPVTLKDVEHIAKLSRLEITEVEKEKYMHQLNDILRYVEKLNELDTTNVEPLAQVNDLQNVFREDIVRPSIPVEEALKNAPAKVDTFFKVPKVIG
jgi:aspartyl-tRNA(Asn)/glutamyl-tRNA(Gln) amidotransferase subunit C